MAGPMPQFDSKSFMFPASVLASGPGPSGPHFDVSGGEMNPHPPLQTIPASNVEFTTPVSNSYQTVSDEGISYNPYSHMAPLFDIPSRAFNTLLQGYRQSPTNGHGAEASRSLGDGNDNHNPNELVTHVDTQSEPVQAIFNGVVAGGIVQEQGEVPNGEVENGGEEVVISDVEGDGQLNELVENGEVNHESSEGRVLSEETEPSEASSAGSSD